MVNMWQSFGLLLPVLSNSVVVAAADVKPFNAPLPDLHGSVKSVPTPKIHVNSAVLASSIVSSLSKSHATLEPTVSVVSSKISTKTSSQKKSSTASVKSSKKTTTTKLKSTTTTKLKSSKKSSKKTSATKKKASTTTLKHVHPERRQASTTTSASQSCVSPTTYLSNYAANDSSPAGFLVDIGMANAALSSWLPPAGYNVSFLNRWNATTMQNSTSSNVYLGSFQLATYSPSGCAAYCNLNTACQGFNIYYQRSPVFTPDGNCTNPASTGSITCALWGNYTSSTQAGNYGQFRQNFMVMIAGSNAYNKIPTPNQISGFSSQQAFTGALDWTQASAGMMSYVYYAGAYNPDDCAAQCISQTASNKAAAVAAGNTTFTPCNYYNTWSEFYNTNSSLRGSWCFMYSNQNVANGALQYASTYNGAITNITRSFGSALVPQNKGFVNTTWFGAPSAYSASCAGINPASGIYTDNNAIQYSLACGYDVQYTQDIGLNSSTSFYNCFGICDNTAGCNGFSYGNGLCYLKNLTGYAGLPVRNPGIDFAWQPAKFTPPSTSNVIQWVTVTQNWTSATTSVGTVIAGGLTATEVTYTSGVVVVPTTSVYTTVYVDSGNAASIVTSTISAASSGGTGTVSVIYPTLTACASATTAAVNFAFYSYTGLPSSTSGWPGFLPAAFKTVTPMATGVSNAIAMSYSDSNNHIVYGQNVSLTNLVMGHTFYIYAGHGTGHYTVMFPNIDEIAFLWGGAKAVSGWNRTTADAIQYSSGTSKQAVVSYFLTQGTYFPVRIQYANALGAATLSVNMWAPDGTAIEYSNVNTGYISPIIVTKPCNAALAPAFPPWGSET